MGLEEKAGVCQLEEDSPRTGNSTCIKVGIGLGNTKTKGPVHLINPGLGYQQSIFRTTAETTEKATQYLTWVQEKFVENRKIMMLPWDF